MRSRRGFPPPIASLPPEILSLIFLHFANEMWYNRTYDQYISSLLLLGQICQLWRELALSLHSLWGKIVIGRHTRTEFFAMLVERARGQPISIAAFMENNPMKRRTKKSIDKYQNALKRTFPRLRHLVIVLPFQESHWGRTFDNFMVSGEQLETLRIEAPGSGMRWRYPSTCMRVPKDLLGVQAAPLTSLTLFNVAFQWQSAFFSPGLTYLKLWYCRTYSDDSNRLFRPSLAGLLVTLAKLPLLKTVKLNWVPARIHLHDPPAMPATPVILANLRTLVFPDSGADMLSYLRFPQTTAVTFCPSSRDEPWNANQQSNLPEDLRSAMHGLLAGMVVYAVSSDTDTSSSNGTHLWACKEADLERILAPLQNLMDSPSLLFLHLQSMPSRVSRVLNPYFGTSRDQTLQLLNIDLQQVRFADLRGDRSGGMFFMNTLQEARNLTALRMEGPLGIDVGTMLTRRVHLSTRQTRMIPDEGARALAPRNRFRPLYGWPLPPATPDGWPRLPMVPRHSPQPTRAVNTIGDYSQWGGDLEDWEIELLGRNEDHSRNLEAETSAYGTSGEPLFPHLRTLLIARVGIPSRTGETYIGALNWRKPELDWQSHMLEIDDLVRALRVRAENQGADEVVCVEFEDCSCAEETRCLVPLICLVPQVKWNRKRWTLDELKRFGPLIIPVLQVE